MVTREDRIRSLTLWRTVLRSFFLQASWNFQRMQNLGFYFAIYPVLKTLYRTNEGMQAAMKRHLEFFNTHPYCASIILGVVAQLEERAQQSPQPEASEANRIKVGMMGPLAALGDTLFWATLKPALALVGVSLVLLSPRGQLWPALLGPVVFLTLFSVAHLGLRVGGVFVGYRRGLEVVKDLRQFNPQLIARRLSFFMALVLGATVAAYPFREGAVLGGQPLVDFAGISVLTAVMFVGLHKGLSVTQLFYLLAGLAVLMASVFHG